MLLKNIYNLSRYNKNKVLYWIFLDSTRITNYSLFLNAIPSSKNIGVIIRSKNNNNLYNISKRLAKICTKKKFTFLVASSLAIAKAVGADGVHYSKNFRFAKKNNKFFISCSVHGKCDVRRVQNLNANFVFISPVFITKSDKEKVPLGLNRISLLAYFHKCQYSVLGGVNKHNIKSLRNRNISSVSGLDYISSSK